MSRTRLPSICGFAVLILLAAGHEPAQAVVLTNPTISASADPFNAGFVAANVFTNTVAEFATSGNGAGTPLSNNVNDGTWINFNFGSAVTIDKFINVTRLNTADVIGTSRLIFSSDATFDAGDTTVSFNPTGSNGAGFVFAFAPQTVQYVRWEAVTSIGISQNLGATEMRFGSTTGSNHAISGVTVIAEAPAFNGNFLGNNAVDSDAGRNLSGGNEYAINGSITGATNAFLDFDLGSVQPITGFDFFDRLSSSDRATSFNLIFSNDSTFSSTIATRSYSPGGTWGVSDVFSAIDARYVRYDITGAVSATGNTGMSEIIFYAAPEPGTAMLGLLGLSGLAIRRRRSAT